MDIDRKKVTELLWDKSFRDAFPELTEDMKKYLAFPTCRQCLETLYQKLVDRKETLESFLGEDVTFVDNKEKQTIKALANVPEQYRRSKVTAQTSTEKNLRPIRRFVQIWEPTEINEKLEGFSTTRYRVESMTELNGKLAVMMLEFGTREKAKVTTEEGMERAMESIERLRALIPEAEDQLKVLTGILAAKYAPSGQQAVQSTQE